MFLSDARSFSLTGKVPAVTVYGKKCPVERQLCDDATKCQIPLPAKLRQEKAKTKKYQEDAPSSFDRLSNDDGAPRPHMDESVFFHC